MFQFVDGRYKRECIPVGCVPPALYRTVGGGLYPDGSLSGGVSVQGFLSGAGWGRGVGLCLRGVFPSPTPVNRMTGTRL